MLKITALATTLVLGLSTAAMAAPSDVYQQRDHRDPISQRDRRMPERFQRWTELASGRLVQGRSVINVSTGASFSKLKLDASRGSLFIDKLVVQFANGQRQVIQLDKRLVGSTLIDLDGRSRQISKIVVVGKGGQRSRSSFTISAV